MIHSNDSVLFDHNLYWYTGDRGPRWSYGGRDYEGFATYRHGSGQDAAGLLADPELTATMRLGPGSPAIDAGTSLTDAEVGAHDAFATPVPRGGAPDIGAVERTPRETAKPAPAVDQFRGSWALVSHLGVDDTSRSQLVFLQSALEQYGERGLVVAVGFHGDVPGNLAWDWNLGRIRSLGPSPARVETLPTTFLVGPDGNVVRRWEGFAPPADLGLTLRSVIGPPAGSPPVELSPEVPVRRDTP
jgi:hypothetical protein